MTAKLLGDPDRQPAVRRGLLDYMRGFLGVTTLAVQRDPELAAFLVTTREQLSRFFPEASIERIWLATGHDPDGPGAPPGPEITVFARQEPDTAREALDGFDAAWWLEHCDYPTRIVIGTHLV